MDAIESFTGAYAFLSNFYPAPVVMDGIGYPTVEHAFQAAKTHDVGDRVKIAGLRTPGEAKRAGRRVKLRADWTSVRLLVMLGLLRCKFSLPELRAKLLATGDRALVEGNTWNDCFWGVCRGEGLNHLGCLLMQVRTELRAA